MELILILYKIIKIKLYIYIYYIFLFILFLNKLNQNGDWGLAQSRFPISKSSFYFMKKIFFIFKYMKNYYITYN